MGAWEQLDAPGLQSCKVLLTLVDLPRTVQPQGKVCADGLQLLAVHSPPDSFVPHTSAMYCNAHARLRRRLRRRGSVPGLPGCQWRDPVQHHVGK